MHDTTLWPDPGRFPPLPSVQGPVGLSTGHALLSVRCAGGQVDYLTNRVQSNPEGSRLSKLNMSRYMPAPAVLQRNPPSHPSPPSLARGAALPRRGRGGSCYRLCDARQHGVECVKVCACLVINGDGWVRAQGGKWPRGMQEPSQGSRGGGGAAGGGDGREGRLQEAVFKRGGKHGLRRALKRPEVPWQGPGEYPRGGGWAAVCWPRT